MTNEEIEAELRHLATKEDLANLRAEFHKALAEQLRWMIGMQIITLGLLLWGLFFEFYPRH